MYRKESELTNIIATKDMGGNIHMVAEWTNCIIDPSGDETEGLKIYKIHSSPIISEGAAVNKTADDKFIVVFMELKLTKIPTP